jgi:hypothetical protein
MSGLPPLSAEPGTPADEWAAKTTSALDPNPPAPSSTTMNPTTRQLFEEKNLRPGTTATTVVAPAAPVAPTSAYVQPVHVVEPVSYPVSQPVETPGREVPGAYPNEDELQSRGAEITQAMQSTASKAAQTASSLAQSVQETAAAYLPKAAETVGQYLPKRVVDTVSSYVRK